MWLHLHRCILQEFASFGVVDRPDGRVYTRGTPDAATLAWRNVLKQDRIRRRWTAALADKVCKHAPCGKAVARPVKPGPIPDYCSPACMKRAKWARWYEAHREERLAALAEQRRTA